MLTKKLQEIDKKLKSLKLGEVIEVFVEKDEAISLSNYYKDAYTVIGPTENKEKLGEYIVAFAGKSKEIKNA